MIRYLPGNHLSLLQNGSEYFPALEAAIDQARQHVYVESYIFAHDSSGQRIAAALMRAARRGIAVHLVIDGFGSQAYPQHARDLLVEAGVKLQVFRPHVSSWRFRRQRLRRLHRKLAVIDKLAFVGGINIINDITYPETAPRFDFTAQVQGPLVGSILDEMRRLHHHLQHLRLRLTPRSAAERSIEPEHAGNMRAAFVQRTNIRHRRDIERAYLHAIGRAHQDIIIANAYFLPGRRFRRALIHAASRGVRVRLLLQGQTDYRFVHYATQSLYHQLLKAGIEIHEYTPSVLHAKVAVVDGRWSTVGSSNIDPFSLFLSREANVVVYDQDFGQHMLSRLEAAIAHDAQQITDDFWRQRSLVQRMMSWVAFGVVRSLAGWVGYYMERE